MVSEFTLNDLADPKSEGWKQFETFVLVRLAGLDPEDAAQERISMIPVTAYDRVYFILRERGEDMLDAHRGATLAATIITELALEAKRRHP